MNETTEVISPSQIETQPTNAQGDGAKGKMASPMTRDAWVRDLAISERSISGLRQQVAQIEANIFAHQGVVAYIQSKLDEIDGVASPSEGKATATPQQAAMPRPQAQPRPQANRGKKRRR